MANAYPTNPIALLGHTIDFAERTGDSLCRYRARVLAVQVPVPGSAIEWALLLDRPGSSHHEYVSLDDLSFAWPKGLSSPGGVL